MNTAIMNLIHGQALLRKGMNRLGIYQLRRDDEDLYHDYLYTPMHMLNDKGYKVRKENYNLVYVADLEQTDTLETIRENLNPPNRPEDFFGRSLSVGDIIILNRENEVTAFFVDKDKDGAECFTELPDFLRFSRNQRQLSVLRSSIPYGKNQKENGYILSDGTALLDAYLDATMQFYTDGVGADGKLTGFCYYPLELEGKTIAFTEITKIEEDGTDD